LFLLSLLPVAAVVLPLQLISSFAVVFLPLVAVRCRLPLLLSLRLSLSLSLSLSLRLSLSLSLRLPFCCHPSAQREDLLFACAHSEFSTEKFKFRGVFLAPEKRPSIHHDSPRNPPQLHHKKPPANTHFPQNTSKMPIKQQSPGSLRGPTFF
jgi:hypothetical protein